MKPKPEEQELEKIRSKILEEIHTLAKKDPDFKISSGKITLKKPQKKLNLPFPDRYVDKEVEDRVTHVKTKTYTRIDLIKAQVEIALCRTTDLSMETIMNSILAGIERHWISQVNVYGLDSENLCRAQLIMNIDWDEYNLQTSNGNATVIIEDDGRKWRDNTAIELNKAISLFNDYVREHSLKTKCYTFYAPGVNGEEANRILGLVKAEPIQWKDKADGFEFEIPEIKELRVGFYCVD